MNLNEELKAHALRMTPQRAAIYKYMLNSKEHPTAEMVYEALKKEYPCMSLNTIYNTLELFEQLGLVIRVFPEASKARFDGNVAPHTHLVCVECAQVFDVDDVLKTDLAPIKNKIFQETGFLIEQDNLLLSGRCQACQQKERREN